MDTTPKTSYIIYRTTCLLNGKIYVGKHQTTDLSDGYLGSGKLLQAAVKKYGVEAFSREILYQFDSPHEMNAKEAELVTEEFCSRDDNYNLCPGGKGGWGYVNKNLTPEQRTKAGKNGGFKTMDTVLRKQNGRRGGLMTIKYLRSDAFKGKHHSEETKIKMSASQQGKQTGSKNSQFGSMWITDGVQNKKIKSVDAIPNGWFRGRT